MARRSSSARPLSLVSMTAFGRGIGIHKRERAEVEIKGVNSRSLDVILRGAEVGATQEFSFRDQLSSVVSRGRVDIYISRTLHSRGRGEGVDIALLPEVVRTLKSTATQIEKEHRSLYLSFGLASLLSRSDLFPLSRSSSALTEDFHVAVQKAFAHALSAFVAMRQREGGRLQRAIKALLLEIQKASERVRRRAGSARARAERRVRARLAAAASIVQEDTQRISQEVSLILDRSDIAEEIERIQGHLKECHSILAAPRSGKRFEFLAQELQREFNTIGSKAQDGEIQRSVVDAKVAIERIREQVQNVE